MKKRISTLFSILSVLTLLFMSTLSHAHSGDAFDVEKAIHSGNHQALAEYYRAQATLQRKEAEKHKKMETIYITSQEKEVSYLSKHCVNLANETSKMAEIYEQLAQEEEKLAKKDR